jgi:HD-GYP domain-containing protein (c-di-GMP phosphodiesterase class II)
MKIKSSSLKEGTRYSRPIFFYDGVNMFLAANHDVRKLHLDIIKRWEIPFLVTEGHVITDKSENSINQVDEIEELEELDDIDAIEELEELDDIDAKNDNKNIYPISYMFAVKTIEATFATWRGEQNIDKKRIDEAVEKIRQFVESEKIEALRLVIADGPDATHYAISAVDVAIVSCVMGMDLGFSKKALNILITAALLHDIGMQSVPEEILKKKGKLTTEEYEQLKMHSIKSATYTTNILLYSREVGAIISQHHEHWDGTGYPEGRKGSDILKTARIISVADAFDAMISTKSYRNSMIAYEAVKNLLKDKQKRFDPAVLKLFIKCIGVYPVGSYVLLNDNSIAIVSESIGNAPFMPNVEIVKPNVSIQSNQKKFIQLREQKNLFIVRALKPEEVTGEKN